MTQDEIIEMAKLAGWEMDNSCVLSPQILWYIYQEQLETFAKLVTQHEREACAEVCIAQMQGKSIWMEGARACSLAIRARGQA